MSTMGMPPDLEEQIPLEEVHARPKQLDTSGLQIGVWQLLAGTQHWPTCKMFP